MYAPDKIHKKFNRKMHPCPWCGVVPQFVEYTKDNLSIECRNEDCLVRPDYNCLYGPDYNKTDMIKIWNSRRTAYRA